MKTQLIVILLVALLGAGPFVLAHEDAPEPRAVDLDGDIEARPAGPSAPGILHDGASVAALVATIDAGRLAIALPGGRATATLVEGVLFNDPSQAPEGLRAFEGTLVGHADSSVRLVTAPGFVDGHVRTADTTYSVTTHGDLIDMEVPTLPQDLLFDVEESDIERDPSLADKAVLPVTSCLEPVPYVPSNPVGLALGGFSPLTYDLILDADARFGNRYGSNWDNQLAAMAWQLDDHYERNMDISIAISKLSLDDGSYYNTDDPSDILTDGLRKWGSDPTERDTVLIMVERDFDGFTVGQAKCIGGAHSVYSHYVTTQSYSASTFRQVAISAHELGHMLSAHHHYSNCHDSQLGGQLLDLCTVMVPDIGLLDNDITFSKMSISTMRGYAEGRGQL